MIIVIAGIKRSGSTLLYNAVRLCLEESGKSPQIHGERFDPNEHDVNELHLVKIHRFNSVIAEQADHVFISNRNYYDIKDSLERFNGEEQRWERIVLFYKWLQKWSLYSTPKHYFEYEQLTQAIDQSVNRIINILELDLTAWEPIVKKLESLEPPESGQDPVSLMFSNHRTQE